MIKHDLIPDRRTAFVKQVLSLYLAFAASVVLLGLANKIAFGHGLEDLVYWGAFAALSLMVLIIYYIVRKSRRKGWVLLLFALSVAVWLLLSITMLRGSEYAWNGSILYNGNQ